jgi:hypothetical protein
MLFGPGRNVVFSILLFGMPSSPSRLIGWMSAVSPFRLAEWWQPMITNMKLCNLFGRGRTSTWHWLNWLKRSSDDFLWWYPPLLLLLQKPIYTGYYS